MALAILVVALPAGASRKRATHGNPHAEVTATARVDTEPRRRRHRNGREFEEFRARLLTIAPASPGRSPWFPLDAGREVRVFHDLSCGGGWVELKPGDRIELKGEYVRPPDGRGIIHFTHPADGTCGRGGGHDDGYLRRREEAASQEQPGARPGIAASGLERFNTSVRPILSARCAPCHEPGGKMYARLPFDDPSTVASHAPRMATRLSGEERRALESWASEISGSARR